MNNGRLIQTLKELYNYMEDRADEEGRNQEYRFLFKIHKGLLELGAGSPEDDKFGVASKKEPLNLSAYSAEEIGAFLNSQKNNFQPKKTPGLNEDVFHVKMGRFTITESEKERIKGLYEEQGKESYFARHGEKSKWVGSSNKTYDNLPDGDYDDEDYDDFDSLHKSRPDFHKHYSGGGGSDRAKSIFDTYRKQEGPLKVKKRKG